MRATGNPDAGPLALAVAEFAAGGTPRSVDPVAQLKVALSHVRPPIWRRVLLPATATLGDLPEVIQVLFGWDGDHLHVFESGKKRYGDPFVNLEGTGDEAAVRIRDAMTAGATIAYTYDLGACWDTRSRWKRRSRGITARFTRSAWRSGATPPSSTGVKRSPRNRSRSA